MSKQLYTLEFPVRCSPSILYEFLSTPAGLGEWFAEKVDERDNIFYFGWNGSFEKAEVMEREADKFIRFHWLDSAQRRISLNFALKNQKSPIKPSWSLKILQRKKKSKIKACLWDHQVKELFHRLGN